MSDLVSLAHCKQSSVTLSTGVLEADAEKSGVIFAEVVLMALLSLQSATVHSWSESHAINARLLRAEQETC